MTVVQVDLAAQTRRKMTKAEKYEKYFMDIALRTAENSYAVRSKVGAVLVKDNHILATGWNGTPSGMDNCCEYTNEDGTLTTKENVIHAEANIIYFCAKNGIQTDNTSLYITLSPCATCALAIIQAGIKEVFFHEKYRDPTGLNILEQNNIKITQI